MEKGLVEILEEINKKVAKVYTGKKKEKLEKEIIGLIDIYKTLEIPEALNETYESLKNKGKELVKESNIKQEKKVDYYLRYCGAAIYDFSGNLKPLNTIMKSFVLTCVLFFVLAPQYFSFILPVIFILPIFLGLKGMRKRVLNGLMMGAAVVPMGILVSIVWIRNAALTISTGTFSVFIDQLAKSYGFSTEFTQNLAIACILMSVALLLSSITMLYNTIKHRKMFI